MLVDLDREEKAPARGFMMTGWGGLDSYTFDRIGRGTIHVACVNISLIGTIQPTRLVSYMRKSLQHSDDGFVQRLQLAVWPDMSPEWRMGDRPPDAAARETAFACCRRLASLNPLAVGAQVDEGGSPIPFLRFTPEARDTFNQWRAELEIKVRSGELSPALTAHLGATAGSLSPDPSSAGLGPSSGRHTPCTSGRSSAR
jgi:hypothetical protein